MISLYNTLHLKFYPNSMANSGKKKMIFTFPKKKKRFAKCATTNGKIAFALYIKKTNAMTAEIVGG